jgi:hypothetical protein
LRIALKIIGAGRKALPVYGYLQFDSEPACRVASVASGVRSEVA